MITSWPSSPSAASCSPLAAACWRGFEGHRSRTCLHPACLRPSLSCFVRRNAAREPTWSKRRRKNITTSFQLFLIHSFILFLLFLPYTFHPYTSQHIPSFPSFFIPLILHSLILSFIFPPFTSHALSSFNCSFLHHSIPHDIPFFVLFIFQIFPKSSCLFIKPSWIWQTENKLEDHRSGKVVSAEQRLSLRNQSGADLQN